MHVFITTSLKQFRVFFSHKICSKEICHLIFHSASACTRCVHVSRTKRYLPSNFPHFFFQHAFTQINMCTYYTYIFKECWQWILTLLKHKFVFFISCCLWTLFFLLLLLLVFYGVCRNECVCVYLMVFGELLWLSEMEQYKTSPALGAQHTSAPNSNEQVIALCNSSGSLPFSWRDKRRVLAYEEALKSVCLYRCQVGLWASDILYQKCILNTWSYQNREISKLFDTIGSLPMSNIIDKSPWISHDLGETIKTCGKLRFCKNAIPRQRL